MYLFILCSMVNLLFKVNLLLILQVNYFKQGSCKVAKSELISVTCSGEMIHSRFYELLMTFALGIERIMLFIWQNI